LHLLRRPCPLCRDDTIIGRRGRQAYDDQHDRIWVRRGLCRLCGQTFTVLPNWWAPPGHSACLAGNGNLGDELFELALQKLSEADFDPSRTGIDPGEIDMLLVDSEDDEKADSGTGAPREPHISRRRSLARPSSGPLRAISPPLNL
jgi:hypothetical protein